MATNLATMAALASIHNTDHALLPQTALVDSRGVERQFDTGVNIDGSEKSTDADAACPDYR